jgi:hypothetical protein
MWTNTHCLLIMGTVYVGLRNDTWCALGPQVARASDILWGHAQTSRPRVPGTILSQSGPKIQACCKNKSGLIALAHVPPFCKRNRPPAMGAGQTDLNTWASWRISDPPSLVCLSLSLRHATLSRVNIEIEPDDLLRSLHSNLHCTSLLSHSEFEWGEPTATLVVTDTPVEL